MNKRIGEKIRQFRVLQGLSQENVAEEIGMSAGNFGKIERGDIDISSSHLQKIARLFKVSVGELFETGTVGEKPGSYGYATKEELEELSKSLHQFIKKEFEKMREEFNVTKNSTRRQKN